MRQTYRIIPNYTADVSGVCSALYELGGMVVMHDPSGCNSTYNTHDEIRWYDQDSLIYISGLTEVDAIMGNDEKLIHDIKEAARELKPRFIALAGSPIPYMNGTDFSAIASVLEEETGIPAFSVPTNGMHDYVYGAGIALEKIAERFMEEDVKCTNPRSLNLLGVTPLDFGPQCCVDDMKKSLKDLGWEIVSTWAMGDSLDTLSKSGRAAVNLVVSSVGLRAAKVLERKFGTPYVVGTPFDLFTQKLSCALEKAVKEHSREIPYLSERLGGTSKVTLIGEPVKMGALASAIEEKYNLPVRVLCPLRESQGLLTDKDEVVLGEEDLERKLKSSGIIVADPLYRPICPADCEFYEMPHIAFSGRIYLKKIKQNRQEIQDIVQVLETNVDDCSGEQLGYTIECLMKAGALDASCFPIYMKKHRPAYMLQVICRKEKQELLEDIIFRETTSIGIRRYEEKRRILPRSFEEIKLKDGHIVKIKICEHHGEKFYYPEYETVKAVCEETGRAYRSVYDEAAAQAGGYYDRI